MNNITVNPAKYRQFGNADNVAFCFVTNSSIIDEITIEEDGDYASYRTFAIDEEGQLENLLRETIPEAAHVLVVSPNTFIRSPTQEAIGSKRKLLAMACNSTPNSMSDVSHFLNMIEATSPDEQQRMVDHIFDKGKTMEHMVFRNRNTGTEAIFKHLNNDYEWNIQAGLLDWGEQQLAPSGEVSVLPADIWKFKNDLKLDICGEVTLNGYPILHAGEVSFLLEDQHAIYAKLSEMQLSNIIAKVENGVISNLRPFDSKGHDAVDMLEKLFSVDSRYRTIWELGFGVNTKLKLLGGNNAMNEVYGSNNGCIHFGLGLTPYTQYHLDIICPDCSVFDEKDNLFFGYDANRSV